VAADDIKKFSRIHAARPEGHSATEKQRLLQALALELMKAQTTILNDSSGYIYERLERAAGARIQVPAFLQQVEDLTGLLVRRKGEPYEFAHKSFQEYLAAVEIKEARLVDLLFDELADPWWEGTVRFYATQAEDASALLTKLLGVGTVSTLALAHECLQEGAKVCPEVRQAVESQVDGGLEFKGTEFRKLAGEVKLTGRLKRMIRLDDDRHIDLGYITCGEYQLFIDDMHRLRSHYQPDHWASNQFTPDKANQPIVGVRASDALEFCRWLSARYAKMGIRYRLPNLEEADLLEVPNDAVGYWCQTDSCITYGIDPGQRELWKEKVRSALNLDRNHLSPQALDLDPNGYFAPDFDKAVNQVLDRVLDRVISDILAHPLDPEIDHARDHAIAFALGRAIDEDRALGLAARDPRIFARPRDKTRTRDRARTFDRVLDHARVRYLAPTADRTLDDRFNDVASARLSLLVLAALFLLLPADRVGIVARLAMILQRAKMALRHLEYREIPAKLQTRTDSNVEQWQNEVINFYAFLVLVDERQNGNLPAWGSIRILSERVAEPSSAA
jgi:Sulfatase-modifying factor enzyme 1